MLPATEAHAKKRDADNEKNEDRTDDGKLDCRRAFLVAKYFSFKPSHG